MFGQNVLTLEDVMSGRKRSVYLGGAAPFYQKPEKNPNPVTKIAPFVPQGPGPGRDILRNFHTKDKYNSVLYKSLKPLLNFMKFVGIFPITDDELVFQVTIGSIIYSVCIFFIILGYVGYIQWDKLEMVRSAEGKFEEAVIDYLFTLYLIPIITSPIAWSESKKLARVLTNLMAFERIYYKMTKKRFAQFLGNKPFVITIALPVFACVTMVVTHVTMAHFKILQVIPYCYINVVTYLIGGIWYMLCDLLANIALTVAEDFKQILRNASPANKIAEFRSLWMLLSRIIRDTGNAFGFTLTFLCLYLFLIITLTMYGLMSQIQAGLGVKDIGLAVTGFFAGLMLLLISDEAHYASNCVKVQFQKKLLLVELNWMSDDTQQEINMFLRATEMNPTDMSLGGFFEVNRNLFKSLIATMVTYLVVLLQFQISIPEDPDSENSTKNP
ncbi:gustatory and odorant receptor 24 [Diorhabda carinulata]|uniref:gustatory and odorant receptor 24 n=1 Tax=Diorhabda carinulata TaxID=1163345 RepID=UPI0025A07E20|nr:gustatory and odorant receptor 24 [Diorhabda carinulata]